MFAKHSGGGKGALTSLWSITKFTCNQTWSGSNSATGMLSKANEAITSVWFWAYVEFILLCAGALEELSSWCEACECHGFERTDCVFKARRSSEFATGAFNAFLQQQCSLASSFFIAASAALDYEDRAALMREWQVAMEIITSTLRVKISNWQTLPWLLCGVAATDEGAARAAGRRAIELFDARATGYNHPVSIRLLQGDLRSDLEDFLGGATRRSLPNLCKQLGALRCMRIAERQTEGLHRDIKACLYRSPNAGCSYVSTELRAKLFTELLSEPSFLEEAASRYTHLNEAVNLSTNSGQYGWRRRSGILDLS